MRDEDEQRHYTEPPRLDEAGLIAFLWEWHASDA
jgi:hypothetical protein